MADRRMPWALVAAAVVAALVAVGALVGAYLVGERRAGPVEGSSSTTAVPSSTVDPQGCRVEPCQVLGTTSLGETIVELVADKGARSGRLRFGGPTSSLVIEITLPDVALDRGSLQCVAGTLSACLVRGAHRGGTIGQVVVGRTGKWSPLSSSFTSDAGYLALAEVTAATGGPEVVAAQHDCDRPPDCAGSPVFAQVFATMTAQEVGCVRGYPDLESLPGYPDVRLPKGALEPC